MTEIYINGKLIELSDEDIVLSFGVNNIFSIESTQGIYSNTFKIPATKKNNIALGISNNILSISDIPYKSNPCEIYVNGLIQVVGLASIKSADIFEYEILIIAGNGNWIDKLSGINLSDILLSCEFTQKWDAATVTGSRSNIWSDVFIYPNIDYGDLFFLTGSDVNYDQLYPAVYCKFLFKKIFETIGYNINSDWFDNNVLFQKQIIPFSAQWQRSTNPILRNYIKASTSGIKPASLGGLEFTFDNILGKACYDFNIPNRMVVLDSVEIDFRFTINYTIPTSGTYSPPLFPVEIGYTDPQGNLQAYFVFPLTDTVVAGTYTQVFDFTLLIGRGEVFFFNQIFQINAGTTLEILDYRLTSDTTALPITTTYNWFELAGTLPNITVADFILTIANQYGLIFQENTNTNTIEVFQFGDIISNLSSPLDWSNKLDLTQEPLISFNNQDYAKKNYLQYSTDDADQYLVRQRLLGQGYFSINQPNLNDILVLFESPFSGVIRLFSYNGPSGIGGTIELAYIPVNEGLNTNDVNQRMAYVEFDTSALLTIQPVAFFTSPQPNVYFSELGFDKLILAYYPLYEKLLNNIKSVSCLIKLTSLDINNLDFRKPVWIDYFGAYFYINLIDQYNITTQDSTQIELILISN